MATGCCCRGRWARSPTVFDEAKLASLVGDIAIGHVRYSTAGVEPHRERPADAHRLRARASSAIGHNGNLVNASELRDELVRQGAIFQSTTDTEVIVHLYARSKAADASRTR